MYFNGTGVGRDYSEASEGWRVLPTRYDDPAYSGGNLDRPALQRLLKDLHAEMVDAARVVDDRRLDVPMPLRTLIAGKLRNAACSHCRPRRLEGSSR